MASSFSSSRLHLGLHGLRRAGREVGQGMQGDVQLLQHGGHGHGAAADDHGEVCPKQLNGSLRRLEKKYVRFGVPDAIIIKINVVCRIHLFSEAQNLTNWGDRVNAVFYQISLKKK